MGDIEVRNMALISRWWWKYLNEEEALWNKVICSTHNWGPNHRLGEGNVLSNSGPWGAICRLGMKNNRVFKVLNEGIYWKNRNGSRILFLEDVWIGNTNLKSRYLRLFSI